VRFDGRRPFVAGCRTTSSRMCGSSSTTSARRRGVDAVGASGAGARVRTIYYASSPRLPGLAPGPRLILNRAAIRSVPPCAKKGWPEGGCAATAAIENRA
jgi:hypothetical protein